MSEQQNAKWTTAGKPLDEPETPFVEQVVLNGAPFGSKLIVTVRHLRGDELFRGDAVRIVWRAAWQCAKALDGWDHVDSYLLDAEKSTIANAPEFGEINTQPITYYNLPDGTFVPIKNSPGFKVETVGENIVISPTGASNVWRKKVEKNSL